MSNSVPESRPQPDITSVAGSQDSLFRRKLASQEPVFPPLYRLIVTTTRGVYAWDMSGVTELFHSGSEGIVAARKLSGNCEMIAVADSQVVILHDVNKGMQRSYRLKGSEGQVRLLKYAGNSSKNLFFTTTLRNSVQSYSLKHSKILDPSDSHPSPPSVFALSSTSHLLLSTSVSPPTIQLRNLGLNVPPILLRPRCSSSAVVAADFHPEAANIFLLAFADGSIAVYDASLLFQNNGTGERIERPTGSGTGGEIGSMKGLHAIGSKARKQFAEGGSSVEDPDGTSIQAETLGITAVALVPGHRATAITVGADGKCCVVDFTQPTRNKAVLLNSWHVRRPATSLSVVYSKVLAAPSQVDGVEDNWPANRDYCIAVGRQDGKVLLFDLGGKPLGKQVLDPKGARVVDVEWAKKEIDAAFAQETPDMPDSWKNMPKRKSLGTDVIKKRSVDDEPTSAQREEMEKLKESFFDFPKDSSNRRGISDRAMKPLGFPHAVGPRVRNLLGTPRVPAGQALVVIDSDSFSCSPVASSNSTSLIVEFSNSPPPVPPRPTPKPGGRLSERRSKTARESPQNNFDESINAGDRRKTINDATPTKLATPKPSPLRHTLFGPRSPRGAQIESWIRRPRDHAHYVIPDVHHNAPLGSEMSQPLNRVAPSKPTEALHPSEPPMALDSASTKSYPPSKLPESPTAKSSIASLRSYKTASTQLSLSETSNDTVVDWSTAASSRRPEPSIREPSPLRTGPQYPLLQVRPAKNAAKGEENRSKKKNGNGSADASTQTSPSAQSSVSHSSRDTGITDVIVHWPSMRKSPRIADISADVVSATASVLELGGYANYSSPEKAQQGKAVSYERKKHNSSNSSKKDRYIPPRLPVKVSPSIPHMSNESTTYICHCEPYLQATIRASLDAYRTEMEQGFKRQRLWLEDLVKGREEGRLRLEEENRQLKAELSRVEKGKGRSG